MNKPRRRRQRNSLNQVVVNRLPIVMALRKVNGRKLASDSGLSQGHMSYLMHGKGQFSPRHLFAVCQTLKFSVDSLLSPKEQFAAEIAKNIK